MVRGKVRWTTRCFFSLQITLYLFFILVQGNEETEEAYRNRKSLVLEYFLPINLPPAVEVPRGREKRDIEGSGEGEPIFSEISNKDVDSELKEVDNSTQNAFTKIIAENEQENAFSNFTISEGSGEVENNEGSYELSSEEEEEENKKQITTTLSYVEAEPEIIPKMVNSSDEEEGEKNKENATTQTYEVIEPEITLKKVNPVEAAILKEDEIIPSTASIENATTTEITTEGISEMIFDTSQDFSSIEMTSTESLDITSTENVETSTTTVETETFTIPIQHGETIRNKADFEENTTTLEAEISTESTEQTTKTHSEDSATFIHKSLAGDYFEETSTISEETSTETQEAATIGVRLLDTVISEGEVTETPIPISTTIKQIEKSTVVPILIPVVTTESLGKEPEPITPTEGLRESTKQIPTTPEMVVEEIFKETKIAHKSLEALPGNILQKENMTLGVDPFPIVTNTRIMDSDESLNSMEPKRLGAYIVIGLILLSFSSLVGYIAFKKRMMKRKRQEFDSRPENHDTEKALLSLSDYKDNSELEENHLKNNEITPIVVKSNSQINKFEKNTNFSSPKNLNTIANEKNIEKDNVLKSTTENLTQVIIEDSPKDLDEDKNIPNTEKLIVRTRMDQDSIPKKPIIINRSSTGYIPISQDTL